jgi:glycine/D-amino acid oxidase-like deaminating enzyme
MSEALTIGVDTGGTFTDLIACDGDGVLRHATKISTTMADPSPGILDAVESLRTASIDAFLHGTTTGNERLSPHASVGRPLDRDRVRKIIESLRPRCALRRGHPLTLTTTAGTSGRSADAARRAATRPYLDLETQMREGSESVELGLDDLRALIPGIDTEGIASVLYEEDSGFADPTATTRAYVAAASREGGTAVEDAPVERIELRNGSVARVVARGTPIACDRVVLAAGAWSEALAAPPRDRPSDRRHA